MKPREFWIRQWDDHQPESFLGHGTIVEQSYDCFDSPPELPTEEPLIHVVEYAALEQAQAEIERLNTQLGNAHLMLGDKILRERIQPYEEKKENEIQELKLMAESYRAILLKLANLDLCEPGLRLVAFIEEARKALEGK